MALFTSTLSKACIALIIFNLFFVSHAVYGEPPFYGAQPPLFYSSQSPSAEPPSDIEHPKLCNYDGYYKQEMRYSTTSKVATSGFYEGAKLKKYINLIGDSISDVGNLIHEVPEGAATTYASSPNGINFPNGATGRASNGKLMIDYFALDAGLPLLPPFKKRDADFSYGINKAMEVEEETIGA